MNITEIVSMFLAPSGDLMGMDKPCTDGEFVYAANHHILVRVPADLYTGETAVQTRLNTMQSMMAGVKGFEFKPLQVTLPPQKTCRVCSGKKRLVDCIDCNGTGWFERGHHEYECKCCEGLGGFPSEETDGTKPCESCDGTGEELHNPVPVDGAHFNRRYLAMLLKLEDIEISVTGDTSTSYFKFKHGYGAIMPTRV